MCLVLANHLRIGAALWLLTGLLAWFPAAHLACAQTDIASPFVSIPATLAPPNRTGPNASGLAMLPPMTAEQQQVDQTSKPLDEPAPDLAGDQATDRPNGQPPVAPIQPQRDSQLEQGQDAVGDELGVPGEERLGDGNYGQLSARIDALDRQIAIALAEKEEFRTGLLEAISEMDGSSSEDRELRFFEDAGFRYETTDGQYALAIRGQVQVDSRIFAQANQDPVNNGFYLPRSRIYFSGRVTPSIEYQLSLQRGFNSLNLLNAYARFRFSEKMRLTVGRFKTPYTFDFYTYKNWQLLSPERSLFNVNFALSRMVGLMANGEFFNDRLEYAVGVFNGPRNSFRETNSAKDIVAFLNFQPWRGDGGKNINIGGSVAYGRQNNPLRPAVLRTSTNGSADQLDDATGVNNANVPFLAFNDGVRELGGRNLWELHTSLYFGPLTILAAWDRGYSGYSRPFENTRVALPLDGYHVQVGYMLTGESVPGPIDLRPLSPFNPRNWGDGLGAWQFVLRYSQLNLGEEVFTEGLADPALWTRRVQMIDVGLNWHLDRFAKVTFDWEHAIFANPIAFNPTPELQTDSDLFWMRLNLVF
jgi:phosphate-selective porin OprO/OprP